MEDYKCELCRHYALGDERCGPCDGKSLWEDINDHSHLGKVEKQLKDAVDFIQTIKDCGIAECNYDNWLGRLMKSYLEKNGDLYT